MFLSNCLICLCVRVIRKDNEVIKFEPHYCVYQNGLKTDIFLVTILVIVIALPFPGQSSCNWPWSWLTSYVPPRMSAHSVYRGKMRFDSIFMVDWKLLFYDLDSFCIDRLWSWIPWF